MKTCPFIAHLLGDEDSEILTIEQAPETGTSPRRTTKSPGRDSLTNHLTCLRETCRFYRQNDDTCSFETLMADLGSIKGSLAGRKPPGDSLGPRVIKELEKVWKFQTRSVSELISHMSDLDRQQRESIEAIPDELKRHIDDAAAELSGGDAAHGADIRKEIVERIDALQVELREKTAGLDGIAETVAGFGSQLEEAIRELQSKTDSLAEAVERTSSEPEPETPGIMGELQERQLVLEQRIEGLAAGQEELLACVKADQNRREVEWMRSNRKEARALNNLGVSSFHNGAFETARDHFVKAIELDPDCAEVYNNLGLAYTELGEEEKASEAFQRATELNPEMPAAYSNLGYLLYKQGSYEKAVEIYNEALGRNTQSSPAYTNLGNAYFKMGKLREAEEAWEKALEIDPGNEKATLYLKQLRAEKL